MKTNSYHLISSLIESTFMSQRSIKARQRIMQLNADYREEQDPQRKRNILWQLKNAQADLELVPASAYDQYSEE